jgi:hypothetical protein
VVAASIGARGFHHSFHRFAGMPGPYRDVALALRGVRATMAPLLLSSARGGFMRFDHHAAIATSLVATLAAISCGARSTLPLEPNLVARWHAVQ